MPSDQKIEPIQLLQLIVLKDRKAFERFYDLLSPLVYALILRMVRSRSDAEELLQDVFYTVWEKAANYDQSRGAPQAWVITIARSRAIDRLRAQRRMPQKIETPEGFSEELLTPDNSSQTLLSLRDERSVIEKELQNISDVYREVIELAYFEGMTQSEIAQKLELPLGTIKTRARDGLKKLRELFVKKRLGLNQ